MSLLRFGLRQLGFFALAKQEISPSWTKTVRNGISMRHFLGVSSVRDALDEGIVSTCAKCSEKVHNWQDGSTHLHLVWNSLLPSRGSSGDGFHPGIR